MQKSMQLRYNVACCVVDVVTLKWGRVAFHLGGVIRVFTK